MAQVKRLNDDIINEKSLFIKLKAVALLAQVKVCLGNSTQQFNLCIAHFKASRVDQFSLTKQFQACVLELIDDAKLKSCTFCRFVRPAKRPPTTSHQAKAKIFIDYLYKVSRQLRQ